LHLSVAILKSSSPTGLVTTRNVKAAELAILSRVQKEDVDRALTNELAMLCEKTRADYLEVVDLLERSTPSLPPSNALFSEDAREEPYLLLAEAENLNIKLRVPAAARETNEHMVRHMVTLTKDALRSCGKTLRRARITLLGVSKTPNMKNHPKRMVKDMIQSLTARGARISVYDPYLTESDVSDSIPNFKKNLNDSLEGADCIVIATRHDQFKRLNLGKLKMAMRKPAAIVDLEGVMDPGKVEREGFIYRGLGRGVWTK
jgi:UDP-N-acetyl-D-mannosaminuronate dehydrogenase